MSSTAAPWTEIRPARVCLIKPSSLGDVVHALPTLAALRTLWPGAHLAWVVNRGLRGLLDGHPDLDEVIPFDRARAGFSPGKIVATGRFLADLRRRRFDLAIDLQGLLRSGIMSAATGAPIRVGAAEAREAATRFYTHRVATGPVGTHAVDRLLAVARALGAPAGTPRFAVACTPADREWARSILAGMPAPSLVVNLGARWLTKRWPPEHFAEVARRAVVLRGAGLLVVGAPEDRPLVDAFCSRLGTIPRVDLCGATTLPQLAALAEASGAFLSNDTGPLHLAAAAGARVVGVYTCTNPRLTGPYGPHALAVAAGSWCAASCLRSCGRMECMADLTPDHVWAAVRRQLDAATAFTTRAAWPASGAVSPGSPGKGPGRRPAAGIAPTVAPSAGSGRPSATSRPPASSRPRPPAPPRA